MLKYRSSHWRSR